MVRMADPTNWQEEGLCRQVGGDLFYPGKGDPISARAAKSVCRGCPVLVECGEHALEAREPFGIWGGMSERDRRLLRARRNREAAASHEQKGAA